MIEAMVFSPLPERFTLPLVGFSEMIGCVTFLALRDRGMALFADEPAVVERIRLLFDEILADEICHVGLVEARIGLVGRRLMRWLFERVGPRMTERTPEFMDAVGADEMRRRLAEPFDQRALAAQFPKTAYAF
jgi:hypothetical protein